MQQDFQSCEDFTRFSSGSNPLPNTKTKLIWWVSQVGKALLSQGSNHEFEPRTHYKWRIRISVSTQGFQPQKPSSTLGCVTKTLKFIVKNGFQKRQIFCSLFIGRWPSGLRRQSLKLLWGYTHRRFESCSPNMVAVYGVHQQIRQYGERYLILYLDGSQLLSLVSVLL